MEVLMEEKREHFSEKKKNFCPWVWLEDTVTVSSVKETGMILKQNWCFALPAEPRVTLRRLEKEVRTYNLSSFFNFCYWYKKKNSALRLFLSSQCRSGLVKEQFSRRETKIRSSQCLMQTGVKGVLFQWQRTWAETLPIRRGIYAQILLTIAVNGRYLEWTSFQLFSFCT